MARIEKVDLRFPYEFIPVFDELETDAERGQLIMAIYNYERLGEEPEFKGELRFAWRTHIKPKMDKMIANYKAKCDARSKAGLKGGRPSKPKKPIGYLGKSDDKKEAENNTQKPNGYFGISEKPKKPNGNFAFLKKPKKPNGVDVDVDVDIDADMDVDADAERNARAHAQKLPDTVEYFISKICDVKSQSDIAKINKLCNKYGSEKFKEAVDIAASRLGKSLGYVEAVIRDPRPRTVPIKPDKMAKGVAETTKILESGELDEILG